MNLQKNRLKYLILIVLTVSMATSSFAQKIYDDISQSFKTGDTELLSAYFYTRINLSILSKEYDPSQSQAKVIISNFFRNHPPTGFDVKFESEKKDSHFIIGTMKTAEKNYRINVFFKNIDDEILIHFLKIEEENETLF
jgi:Domain of unknown function (DUF4783)